MWNRSYMAIAAISVGLTASLVSSEVAYAARSRNYTPAEFRAVLRGFGYNVTIGNTLTDPPTVAAIREFQRGYKITADGIAGPQTQDLAANLVSILQANLNLVVKPSPGLPKTQFYGSLTEAAVGQYQKQSNLAVTGIANLQLRQRIDREAEAILNNKAPAGSTPRQSAPQPSPSPEPSTPSTAPAPEPSTNPSTQPSPSPQASPSPSPS